MYLYLLSTKARATPETMVSTTFRGESKTKFEYGKANVPRDLAEILIARRLASPFLQDWGSVPSASNISLAPISLAPAVAGIAEAAV